MKSCRQEGNESGITPHDGTRAVHFGSLHSGSEDKLCIHPSPGGKRTRGGDRMKVVAGLIPRRSVIFVLFLFCSVSFIFPVEPTLVSLVTK